MLKESQDQAIQTFMEVYNIRDREHLLEYIEDIGLPAKDLAGTPWRKHQNKYRLTEYQTILCDALWKANERVLATQTLNMLLYNNSWEIPLQDRIKVHLCNARKRLKGSGVLIRGMPGRRGGGYRMLRPE